MDFGKTLVGGLLGAVVGGGAHAGIEIGTGAEASWFPLVTGVLTGLGVRKFDPSVLTSASYLRGAIAALLGLAGIFGGIQGSSAVQSRGLSEMVAPEFVDSQPAAVEESEEAGVGDEQASEEPPTPPPAPAVTPGSAASAPRTKIRADNFSVWNFVMIGLGAFLAYELGRGNNATTGAGEGDSDSPGDAPPRQPPIDHLADSPEQHQPQA